MMNLIFHFPKDKTDVEDGVAYIKAFLMQRYIDNLEFDESVKKEIRQCLIEELKKT